MKILRISYPCGRYRVMSVRLEPCYRTKIALLLQPISLFRLRLGGVENCYTCGFQPTISPLGDESLIFSMGPKLQRTTSITYREIISTCWITALSITFFTTCLKKVVGPSLLSLNKRGPLTFFSLQSPLLFQTHTQIFSLKISWLNKRYIHRRKRQLPSIFGLLPNERRSFLLRIRSRLFLYAVVTLLARVEHHASDFCQWTISPFWGGFCVFNTRDSTYVSKWSSLIVTVHLFGEKSWDNSDISDSDFSISTVLTTPVAAETFWFNTHWLSPEIHLLPTSF